MMESKTNEMHISGEEDDAGATNETDRILRGGKQSHDNNEHGMGVSSGNPPARNSGSGKGRRGPTKPGSPKRTMMRGGSGGKPSSLRNNTNTSENSMALTESTKSTTASNGSSGDGAGQQQQQPRSSGPQSPNTNAKGPNIQQRQRQRSQRQGRGGHVPANRRSSNENIGAGGRGSGARGSGRGRGPARGRSGRGGGRGASYARGGRAASSSGGRSGRGSGRGRSPANSNSGPIFRQQRSAGSVASASDQALQKQSTQPPRPVNRRSSTERRSPSRTSNDDGPLQQQQQQSMTVINQMSQELNRRRSNKSVGQQQQQQRDQISDELNDLEYDLLSKEKAAAAGRDPAVGAYRVPPSSGLPQQPGSRGPHNGSQSFSFGAGSSSHHASSYSRNASMSMMSASYSRRASNDESFLLGPQDRRASNTTDTYHSEEGDVSHACHTHYPNPMSSSLNSASGGGDQTVAAVAVPVDEEANYRNNSRSEGNKHGSKGGWLKGKKMILLISVLVAIIVGLGAGIGIALSSKGGGESQSASLNGSTSSMQMDSDDGGMSDHDGEHGGDHGGDHGDDGHGGHGGHGDDHGGAADHMDHSMGDVDETSRIVELTSIDGIEREGEFGTSISLSESGKRIAVSSAGYWQGVQGNEPFPRRGLVRVYSETDNGSWERLGNEIKLIALDDRNDVADERNIPLPVQRSIQAVELSRDGTRLAVGSAFHDSSAMSKNVGVVQIFEYDANRNEWKQVGQPIYGSSAGDYSGASVSLSYDGKSVAIGSPGHDGAGGVDCGQVRIYQYNDSSSRWLRNGSKIDGELKSDMIGGSVELSADGQIVAIAGASKHGDKNSVIVRVYENKFGQWSPQGSGIKDPLANGLFDMGWSISLSAGGTVLVCSNYYIGSGGHIDTGNANDGHTHDGDADDEGLYVQSFHLMNGEWEAMGGNMHSHTMGPRSGYVVSISDDGRTIGMGDPGRAENGKSSGHAHVYRYYGSMWQHSHEDKWKIIEGDVLGMAAGDAFGHSVALSRNSRRFAVGAPFNRNQGYESGSVQIFDIQDV